MPIVLGVDGGGTKTAVVCVDTTTKQLLGSFVSPCSNPNSVGIESAKEAVKEGILGAMREAKVDSTNQVLGVCLGMSGVDRPEDKTRVMEWVFSVLPSLTPDSVLISNDAVVALASGTGGVVDGIVVISGTGMIVYGFREGKEIRSGGWGPLLGDEGSGYHLGQEILRAVTKALDGRGPQTMLLQETERFLGLSAQLDLINWAYKDHSWKRFADLAPLVGLCARKGDLVALQILNYAASQLMENISVVVKRMGINSTDKISLVFAGGNLNHQNSELATALREQVQAKFPNIEIKFPSMEPAHAAALLAFHSLKK